MQFNVAHLLKGVVGTSQRYGLDGTFTPREDSQTDHVWGEVQLMHVKEGIWLSGSLDANAVCACSRCLEDFSVSLRLQLDELYVPSVDIASGTPVVLDEGGGPDFTIDAHHLLDITEAVRQSIIVALPMKPLCRADCAGLCPQCGVNQNEVACTCPRSQMDPTRESLLRATLLRGRIATHS